MYSGPVPQLTHRQHFKFGYTRNGAFCPFSLRASESDRWTVQYGRSARYPMSFRSECLETARIIQQTAKESVNVMFSGGVDSEVALRSFYEAGVPVSASILKLKNDLNLHDYSWAILTCEELGIPYKLYELDLHKFWTSPAALQLARDTQCISPQLLATMWLVDQCEGFCVLGSGENFLHDLGPESTRPGWHLSEKEKIAAWYRHFILRGRNGCPGFFQYTPELMLSWLLDPIAINLWRKPAPSHLDSLSTKFPVYRQHFNLRPRPKYTGFEKVAPEDATFRNELQRLFPNSNEVVNTPVHELIRQLSVEPDLFPSRNLFAESSR